MNDRTRVFVNAISALRVERGAVYVDYCELVPEAPDTNGVEVPDRRITNTIRLAFSLPGFLDCHAHMMRIVADLEDQGMIKHRAAGSEPDGGGASPETPGEESAGSDD